MSQAQLLVVDDEPELRSLLSEYLTRNGLAVRTAADAASRRSSSPTPGGGDAPSRRASRWRARAGLG